MLKVAIVGCGKIADAHASQIRRIKGCEIVGVCDTESLMARQLYDRFPVRRYFSDLTELLNQARPDVVHVTTPPNSHFDIARICLEAGCHVYVEKPFTLTAEEAQSLIALSIKRCRCITVGHDGQFTHAAQRMRELIRMGYLGGPPIHMESSFCYNIADPTYARALLGDKQHWVRRLPGRLLHNIISHGIAPIAEFLSSDSPEVIAYGFVSSLLKGIGETELIDELRVIISEGDRMTAYFTFSSQMRPVLYEFRIYGPKNGIVLNQDHQTLIKLRGARFKSYLEQFVPPVIFAQQHLANAAVNIRSFLKGEANGSGLYQLIKSFYRSITEDAPVPIPYREIELTAKIMDLIFEQIDVKLPRDGVDFKRGSPALVDTPRA